MSKPTYYKIAGNGSMFWDAGQSVPENQKLVTGDVKPLEPTELVMRTLKAGGLEKVSEEDYKALVEAKEAAIAASDEAAKARTTADLLASAQPVVLINSDAAGNTDVLKEAIDRANKAEASAAELQEQLKAKIHEAEESAAQLRAKEEQEATKKAEAEAKKVAKVTPVSGTGEPAQDDATKVTPRTTPQ